MSLYIRPPSFILGFHGCDQAIKDSVLRCREDLLPSRNAWDWLGHGIYFWENDPIRAMEWATEVRERKHKTTREICNPAVIGAIIDLGNCLDLMNRQTVAHLEHGYNLLKEAARSAGSDLPKNKGLLSELDCAVIQALHENISKAKGITPYDSVKGLFTEGNPIYETSKFMEKTHVQVCVRNKNCIKGYFDPLKPRDNPFV